MKRLVSLLLPILLAGPVYAGSWGSGSFENDDAMDWINECLAGSGAKPLTTVFSRVKNAKFVEAPDGAAAVAAAEVVAAALGKQVQGFPEELRRWLAKQPKSELIAQAGAAKLALKKVQDPKSSELQQLWAEGKSTQWVVNVKDLESRLEIN